MRVFGGVLCHQLASTSVAQMSKLSTHETIHICIIRPHCLPAGKADAADDAGRPVDDELAPPRVSLSEKPGSVNLYARPNDAPAAFALALSTGAAFVYFCERVRCCWFCRQKRARLVSRFETRKTSTHALLTWRRLPLSKRVGAVGRRANHPALQHARERRRPHGGRWGRC